MNTRVIGSFRPSKYRKEVIFRELGVALWAAGWEPVYNDYLGDYSKVGGYNDVRMPAATRTIANVLGWHHDGGVDQYGGFFVVWSNCYPTQARTCTGEVLIPRPYDLFLIDNREVEHRIDPRSEHTKRRWFARQVVKERDT